MSRWRAIVFDLDDTLYPERDYVLGGFRAVAQWAETHLAIPYDAGYVQLRTLYESGVRGDTFNRWLQMHTLDSDGWTPELVRVYRRHTPQLAPFPGVPELLARLHSDARLGLVSDGYLDVQRRKLVALGLEPNFDAVVFSDEWGRDAWKPSTIPFEVVLQRLHVAPVDAVYVADNPSKDFLGARRLGMSTIRTLRAGSEYAHLLPPTPEHAPDHTIMTLEDLETLL